MATAEETTPLVDGKSRPKNNQQSATQIKPELRLRNLGFEHHNERTFYFAQWRWLVFVFPLYRVVAATYVVTWLYLTMLHFPHRDPYPWQCYLTNWSYTLLSCHLVLAAAITVVHTAKHGLRCGEITVLEDVVAQVEVDELPVTEEDNAEPVTDPESGAPPVRTPPPPKLPWVIKLDWMLYSIITNVAPIVTAVYFTILYPLINAGKPPSIQDFHVHGVNSIIIVLELCMCGIPVRLGHAIYPFAYGLVYGLFSLLYWNGDHNRVIYPLILDWNTLRSTIPSLLILGFVLVPIVQLVLFGAYRLRMKLYARLYLGGGAGAVVRTPAAAAAMDNATASA